MLGSTTLRATGSSWAGLRACGIAAVATLVLGSAMGACGARSELEIPAPSREESQGGGLPIVCEGFSSSALPATLDVFFTIDTSGSMEAATALGPTKWAALTEAITGYLNAPESAGQRIGLTFFPQHDWDIPAICLEGIGCGIGGGQCTPLGNCTPTGGTLCETDDDCSIDGDHCEGIGLCQNGNQLCDPLNNDCPTGPCAPAGYCEDHTFCESEKYEITGLAQLPNDAGPIIQALMAADRDGFTPTLPALQGAVDSAIRWQRDNPQDKVVVVIATDGVPSLCDPSLQSDGLEGAFDNLAAVAAQGAEAGVPTFVAGVFAPDEEEQAGPLLDRVAAAGDSGKAFVVSTDEDVAQRLLEAFSQIRLENVCDFVIPAEGFQLDLARVKVFIEVEAGNLIELPRKASEEDCGDDAGFYYDSDPAGPTPPSRIVLCPATCDTSPPNVVVTCGE